MVPYPCLDCLLGLYAETFMCSPSTWQGQTACQLSASHLYASYSYANTYFPWAYHYMRPEWGLGVLRVNMWKYCVLTPKRHYPAWIRVCCCMHDKIGSTALALGPWKDFCVRRNKKVSGNFGYMGRSNPWGELDQMWHVGRYGGRNHVCSIWWLSVKSRPICELGETGRFALSQ